MGRHTGLFGFCCLVLLRMATAQEVPAPQQQPTITVRSTLVLVPALVKAQEPEMGLMLTAKDFKLTDDGVPQKVTLESNEGVPLAVEVLMQTGGAAGRQFEYYRGLPTMLDYMMGETPHSISLATFDSKTETVSKFVTEVEALKGEVAHLRGGDDGAAVLDAVMDGLDRFDAENVKGQRIIVLLSQPYDSGSTTKLEEVIRRLGETNTTIYSVTFSPEKTWLKDQFTKPRHEQAPYQMNPIQPPILHTFDWGTPLKMALKGMQENAAAEVAALSGGEAFDFGDRKALEQDLSVMANHIPNRYRLSFRPTEMREGYHAIGVSLPEHPGMAVSARKGYWAAAEK